MKFIFVIIFLSLQVRASFQCLELFNDITVKKAINSNQSKNKSHKIRIENLVDPLKNLNINELLSNNEILKEIKTEILNTVKWTEKVFNESDVITEKLGAHLYRLKIFVLLNSKTNRERYRTLTELMQIKGFYNAMNVRLRGSAILQKLYSVPHFHKIIFEMGEVFIDNNGAEFHNQMSEIYKTIESYITSDFSADMQKKIILEAHDYIKISIKNDMQNGYFGSRYFKSSIQLEKFKDHMFDFINSNIIWVLDQIRKSPKDSLSDKDEKNVLPFYAFWKIKFGDIPILKKMFTDKRNYLFLNKINEFIISDLEVNKIEVIKRYLDILNKYLKEEQISPYENQLIFETLKHFDQINNGTNKIQNNGKTYKEILTKIDNYLYVQMYSSENFRKSDEGVNVRNILKNKVQNERNLNEFLAITNYYKKTGSVELLELLVTRSWFLNQSDISKTVVFYVLCFAKETSLNSELPELQREVMANTLKRIFELDIAVYSEDLSAKNAGGYAYLIENKIVISNSHLLLEYGLNYSNTHYLEYAALNALAHEVNHIISQYTQTHKSVLYFEEEMRAHQVGIMATTGRVATRKELARHALYLIGFNVDETVHIYPEIKQAWEDRPWDFNIHLRKLGLSEMNGLTHNSSREQVLDFLNNKLHNPDEIIYVNGWDGFILNYSKTTDNELIRVNPKLRPD